MTSQQTADRAGGDDRLRTPIEMLYQWERDTPDLVYLRQSRGDGTWDELTWKEVSTRVRKLASFLDEKGYPAGSNIAIWSGNSADWFIVDLAIMMAGHVSVPLYVGQHPESVNHILLETQAPLIFLGPNGRETELDDALTSGIERVGMMGCTANCGASLGEILVAYAPREDSPVPAHSDLLTIIYSSGTTGRPKGVMHAHGTSAQVSPKLAANLGMQVYDPDKPEERDRLFSFLPLAHAAERTFVELVSYFTNASVSFSSSQEKFAEEIASVQPTFFFAVPRLWAVFKAGVEQKLGGADPANLPEETKAGIRTQMGLGSARFVLTGSAPTPLDTHEFYRKLGIILREGYGMTETFACGTTWPLGTEPRPDAVGIKSDLIEFKLSEEGEVLMKSPGCMLGYYKNDELTSKVIEDDWYHSGDLGVINEDGSLSITGRLGDVFKTAKGKFCQPDRVESHFHAIDELEQLVLIGRGLRQPVVVANLAEIAASLSQATIVEQVAAKLETINDALDPHEKVSQVFITRTVWTTDNGLLTPTMKQKRPALETHYVDEIRKREGGELIQWIDT